MNNSTALKRTTQLEYNQSTNEILEYLQLFGTRSSAVADVAERTNEILEYLQLFGTRSSAIADLTVSTN
jgi:hypothetical protein